MIDYRLKKQEEEIKKTILKIQKSSESNSWNAVSDLTKYLSKLLKQRKEYIKFKKGGLKNE